jgi:hypothetical protein
MHPKPEEARADVHPAVPAAVAREQRDTEEFSAACREAVSLARQLVTVHVKAPSPDLLCTLKQMPESAIGSPKNVITDVEAILIRATGLSNTNQMNFTAASEWFQVKAHEADYYLGKVAGVC